MSKIIFSFVVSVLLASIIIITLVNAPHYRVSVVDGSISILKF